MIYLAGVWHDYQWISESNTHNPERLKCFLQNIINTFSINVIAEEFNEQAKNENNANSVVCVDLADSNSLRHVYCDPEEGERMALGIRSLNQLRQD